MKITPWRSTRIIKRQWLQPSLPSSSRSKSLPFWSFGPCRVLAKSPKDSSDADSTPYVSCGLRRLTACSHGAPSTITPDLLSIDTPPPESSHTSSKGVKKRKSWGQVLPEPKTSLPPRKRAKTADEKEQRRIERVKRNRLAAHNSRERKREEMEKLQLKNDALKDRMLQMQKQMEAMAQELKAFRSGSTPAVSAFDFASIPEIPASMLSPPMTATASSTLQTPELGNLDSPRSELNDDFSVPATPTDAAFGGEEELSLELTQQSAALLCDLQCRSPETSPSRRRSSSQRRHLDSQSPSRTQQLPQEIQMLAWATLLTFSLNTHLFLSTTSTISSTSTTSSLFHRLFPTTPLPTSTSSTTARHLISAICWTTALARQATSSTSSPQPTMAHLHKVATGLAARLRRELTHSSSKTRSHSEEASAVGDEARSRRRRQHDVEDSRESRVEARLRRRRRRAAAGLSRHGRRIVVSWGVKAACSGMAAGGRPGSLTASGIQKLLDRRR